MKYLETIAMLMVSLCIVIGGVVLIANRLSHYFPVFPYGIWLWFMIISAILFLMVGQALSITSNSVGRVISSIGALWMGFMLYFILAIFVVELGNFLFEISPVLRGAIALIISLLVMVYGYLVADNFKIKEITIPITGLTKNIKAVHITDMHLGNFRGKEKIRSVVDKINEIGPDVIFNTGDQFDSKRYFNNDDDVLQPYLDLKAPQYFVYGNHDQYVGENEVIERMENVGVIVLQNEVIHFGELQIIGLNNMPIDKRTRDIHSRQGEDNIEEVLNSIGINEDEPTILLHHRPEGIEYAEAHQVDLMLSGHTHAGQMFPISIITNWIYKYNRGLYQFKDMIVYVSEGVGTIFTPIRVGTNSDITIINLIPKK